MDNLVIMDILFTVVYTYTHTVEELEQINAFANKRLFHLRVSGSQTYICICAFMCVRAHARLCDAVAFLIWPVTKNACNAPVVYVSGS
jgi:hypothetical protein